MVASSTIGVAGTVFSITIAALSLAAGQMGPRLLRNFTRDRGVQIALGTFLGTFTFALMVLRAVRDKSEGAFVPHLALSTAIFFALVCVGMLIYFVDHMASCINVDTVIALVSADLRTAFQRLTSEEPCLVDCGVYVRTPASGPRSVRARGSSPRFNANDFRTSDALSVRRAPIRWHSSAKPPFRNNICSF